MTLKSYIKERIGFLFIHSIAFILIVSILLLVAQEDRSIIILCLFLGIAWYVPLIGYMTMEFMKYKRYYHQLIKVFEQLTPKYLLPEVIESPGFEEGRLFFEVLQDVSKEMHEEVNKYKLQQQDYKDYIESWIHEIKTPIAAAQLLISNNEGPITYKIQDEVKRIEEYVEQVLYYARSNDTSKDYLIKAFDLRRLVVECIKEQSRLLIQKKIIPQIEDFNEIVYSDVKWVGFICNQILYNSIQYSKSTGGTVHISATRNKNNVILKIQDTGIGIEEKDIGRVFDKGFTGENGRRFNKATGMGLYLCKKLCDKLEIGIRLESKMDVGTTVYLIFPIGDTMAFSNEERR